MPTPDPSRRAYNRVLAAVATTPWAIEPAAFAAICEVLELRLAGVRLSDDQVADRIAAGPGSRDPYEVGGGIAVLPVYGVIVPRANLMTEISGGTSLQKLGGALDAAAADPAVSTILLDINSPGGSVSLVPETAAKIRAARASKPVIAHANTMAASAAYWLASQADEIIVSPSGAVGSIGVLSAHEDESGKWEQQGVHTTLISAGRFKTEGNPFEPLTEEGRASIQALVDDFYGQFVADVAKGRGVDRQAVRGGFGEGRVVFGRHAVTDGMADRTESFEATLARLARSGGPRRRGGGAAADGVDDPTVEAQLVAPLANPDSDPDPAAAPADEQNPQDQQDGEGLERDLDYHLALRRLP